MTTALRAYLYPYLLPTPAPHTCVPAPTPATYHLIPQIGVIGLTTVLLVWAAGFRAWGVWVSPSILANESLYYPLDVRRQPGRGEGG